MLTGCKNGINSQTNENPTFNAGDDDFIAYDVFVEKTENIYEPDNILDFQILKSDTSETIINKNISGFDIACVKDNNGNIYAVLSDNPNNDYYNCFYEIGDAEYPYSSTIEISEYNAVLNNSGFILSFGVGANYKAILYFYVDDKKPKLLVECDKSNYEIDPDNEGNKKLVTNFGSMISEVVVYYSIQNVIYRINLNDFISKQLCADNETASIMYDNTKNKFTIDILDSGNLNSKSSKEAYILDNILYIK